MKLIAITENGAPESPIETLPAMAADILEQTASLYAAEGYAKPWVGYFGVENNACVGFCAFKTAPADGAVEIAYATVPELEGRGVATAMARELIALARREEPGLAVRAQTLPEDNASTTILRKLGFQLQGEVDHPEDGRVWEWRLDS